MIFRYLEEKSFSKIKADYLLENHLNDSVSYLFIAKNNEWFAAVSLFEKGTQNYSKGMPKYAILKKIKSSWNIARINVVSSNILLPSIDINDLLWSS